MTQQALTPTSAGLALANMACLFIKNFGIKSQKDAVEITKIKRKKILPLKRKGNKAMPADPKRASSAD